MCLFYFFEKLKSDIIFENNNLPLKVFLMFIILYIEIFEIKSSEKLLK